jgi:hypothetical protein
MKKTVSFFLIILAMSIPFSSNAQCKRMAKRAVKDLVPFRFNGQLSSVVLSEGESAELNIVFSGGKKYRILSKGGRGIGALAIKIYDRKKVLVYDNADHAMAQVWDFENKATQNFTIEVKFPITDEGYNDVTAGGCVAIVIGVLQNN